MRQSRGEPAIAGRHRRVSRRQLAVGFAAAGVARHLGMPRVLAQPRLAEGTLLVRGAANLAGGEMAWRVVQDMAEPAGEAIFEQRALGFSVNTGLFTDLLLTDEATGSAYRLAHDQAAFVRDGTMQRRESLGASASEYLRIALVPAGRAGDAGGDRLVFAGAAFTAPVGGVTLTLERLELQEGEQAYAIPGLGQVLILVLQGDIEIEEGEAGPRTRLQTVVGSGVSYAAHTTPWGTSISSLRDGSYVLLATIQ